jgi:hypothetical protein
MWARDLALRAHDSGRYGQLTNVPHRVLGTMHQAADDGRRKPRSAHSAKVSERRDVDCSELRDRGVDPRAQRIEHRCDSSCDDRLAL